MTDLEVLAHFDFHDGFRRSREKWTAAETDAFVAFARAIHGTGLDWYFVDIGTYQLRFGRKWPRRIAEEVVGHLDGSPPRIWIRDRAPQELRSIGDGFVPVDDKLPAWVGEHRNLLARLSAPERTNGLWPDEHEDPPPPARSDQPELLMTTNLILYGPPGTGKTYATAAEALRLCGEDVADAHLPERRKQMMERYRELMAAGRIEFVTFHQSMSYEDFVESMRPSSVDEGGNPLPAGFRLVPTPGVFRRIARRAETSQEQAGNGAPEPFVLIIDEINRANISKVFGELITLIEDDKRLGRLNELKVRLPYSQDLFGVPANLNIVATMNTADRSIALIDKALRRRFAFREMMPDLGVAGLEIVPEGVSVTLSSILETLNERIEYFLDREHQIGHAWLLGCTTRDRLDQTMRDRIIPLIAEYFFEDWGRTADVLGGRGDNNPFLKPSTLRPPPGVSGGESRQRWSMRSQFAADAYDRLVGPR
ncbi:MAG: AAA family ATPase [Bauldia sp.]|nr:AAA family ATPase [Bauldia sp.]